MLIVNHDQLCLAGIVSLEEPCDYCSKTLAEYPLILSDDAEQTVYHAACALQFATEILVDLFTIYLPTLSARFTPLSIHYSRSGPMCNRS